MATEMKGNVQIVRIDRTFESYEFAKFKQGSTWNKLIIYVTDQGLPYNLETNENIIYRLQGATPDNRFIFRDATSVHDNVVEFDALNEYITCVDGTCEDVCLSIWNNSDIKLDVLLEDITIKIEKNSFYTSNVINSDQLSTLNKLILKADEKINECINATEFCIQKTNECIESTELSNQQNIEFKANEDIRKASELERISDENTRKASEITRETKEAIREQQEESRQTNTQKAIDDCNETSDRIQEKADNGDFNGKSIEYNWDDTSLGIRIEGQEDYEYTDLKGDSGVYFGATEPTNPDYDVWISPEDTEDVFATVAGTGDYNDLKNVPIHEKHELLNASINTYGKIYKDGDKLYTTQKKIEDGVSKYYWMPYVLSKEDLNLEYVDNTSDANKPISIATQTALDTKLDANLKGNINGVAELDSDGKIPSSQLPSYVDDIIEGTLSTFPVTGESGKIYVDTDTDKSYRWSGTAYRIISETIALGITSSTAYRGDYGNMAYLHSQSEHAPSDAQKNSDITKEEIENKLTGDITSHSHTIPISSSSTIGGIKTGYNENNKNYPVLLDTNNNAYVSVPWVGGSSSYDIGNETNAGIGKLYNSVGTNTDGSMTQNAINEINNKLVMLEGDVVLATDIGRTVASVYNPVFTGSFSQNRKEGTVIGEYSHAEGYNTTASGENSHAEGANTVSSNFASHAGGKFNKEMATGEYGSTKVGDVFVIGNGSSTSDLSNAFRVTYTGETYGLSSFNSSGADYAEYFEWLDGNPSEEDRIGRFVTMDGKYIKYANSESDYILGIVSGNPCIIGNSDEDWLGRWLHDDFGRFLTREVISPVLKTEVIEKEDGTTEIIEVETGETITGFDYVTNPNYNNDETYIERKDRKEWSAIGMMGVLSVIDDGTCEVNGFCTVKQGGIATKSDKGYRVIERKSDNVISVVFK